MFLHGKETVIFHITVKAHITFTFVFLVMTLFRKMYLSVDFVSDALAILKARRGNLPHA